MKQLAAEADERWNSVPSFLDAPNKQQPQPAIGVQDPGGYLPKTELEDQHGAERAARVQEDVKTAVDGEAGSEDRVTRKKQERVKKPRKENPWAENISKGAPSENWQPDTWSPGVAQRGR